MEKAKFTELSPGRCVSIPQPYHASKSDWAFVPEPLPPKWDFHPRLWPLLVEANGRLEKLDGIGQTLPNPELLLRPLQEREAISSSRIEGTFVTPQQLMLLQVDSKEKDSSRSQMGEWLEVFNYGKALQVGHSLTHEMNFSDHLFRTMHATLMSDTQSHALMPGAYRTVQVQIGHSGRFIPPPPSEIGFLLANFREYVNASDRTCHPLICAFIAHYQFEAIHPFQDGNGRIGRAILALMISRWLGHSMPWLYLSAFFEKYKSEYIDFLFRVSTHGEWTEWIEFCLHGTISQADDSIRRFHAFDQIKKEFHQAASHAKRTYDLIEGLFSSPVTTVSSAMKRQNVSYDTAKKDIERLVKIGILRELEDVYPRTFICDKIMDIAFSETLPEEYGE
ncbi:MAG: Fic family protein [Planctomycetaceae bacterium]|nr:Fic family protein [Planctomycetaceae bacterium]